MKNQIVKLPFAFLALFLLALLACTADYDTFGVSDYKTFSDISFDGQDGNVSVYSSEHKIKVKLNAPEEGESWDSVTIGHINISSMATLHLVDGKFKEFPSDSVALDSLAQEVSYAKKVLRDGDAIRIPSSLVVYLMVVSESGEPAIWQVSFTIPGVEISSSSSVKRESSSSVAPSENNKSSDSKNEEDVASSSSKQEEPDDVPGEEPAGDPAKAPRIERLEIGGHNAILDSTKVGEDYVYHFHVDDLEFLEDLTSLEVSSIDVSEGGTCNISAGESYDFSGDKTVTVENADGDKFVYTVKAGYQYPNSSFEKWSGNVASEWANGNTAGFNMTSPTNGGKTAKMESMNAKILGIGQFASGNLFTGYFNPKSIGATAMLKYEDGNELIDFGRPFAGRPKYVEVDFTYNGKGDSCDVYFLLENRTLTASEGKNQNRGSSDVNTLVASAWYRSTTDDNSGRPNPDVVSIVENENGYKTLRMKFRYGKPDDDSPIYNSNTFKESIASSNGIDNHLVEGDGSAVVTHIRAVMASSADGNHYKGTVGATLIVNEVRLIY